MKVDYSILRINGELDEGSENSQGHAEDSIEVTLAETFLFGQTTQTQDEEDPRNQVSGRYESVLSFLAKHFEHAVSNEKPAGYVDGGQKDRHSGENTLGVGPGFGSRNEEHATDQNNATDGIGNAHQGRM